MKGLRPFKLPALTVIASPVNSGRSNLIFASPDGSGRFLVLFIIFYYPYPLAPDEIGIIGKTL